MGIQQDVIKKFVKALDNSTKTGKSAINEAINYASNGIYATWNDLVTAFVNDIKNYGGSGSTSTTTLDTKTDNFLKTYCGIDLTNDDTGSITGYDTGGSTVQKTAASIVLEDTSIELTYPSESSTTYNGVTIKWPSNSSSLTSKQYEIISALYSWWLQPALDLVEESLGISFKESDAVSTSMTITFVNRSSSVLASANLYNLTINMNAFSSVSISGASNSGSRSKGAYFDRILAHEMTHAVMSTNETEALWDSGLVAVDEGLAELVHGCDDTRRKEIIALAQSASASNLEKVLNYSYSTSADYYDAYAGGYMIWRYFAKQMEEALTVEVFDGTASIDLSTATSTGYYLVDSSKTGKVNAAFSTSSNTTDKTKVGSVSTKNVYSTDFENAQIISAANSSKSWTISGTSGNDTITGSTSADSISGGEGNDQITGNGGNDTLIGGNGNDTFYYSSTDGDDLITDYVVGEDVIKISSGSIDSSTLSGNDVILYVGEGSIKIKDGKGKLITVNNSSNKTSSEIYGIPKGLTYNDDETAITIDSNHSGTLNSSDYYSSVLTINSSVRSSSIIINGNAKANTIYGGKAADTIYGGNGADMINGNNGNDLIYGDSGNDLLNGGAGNDTLFGGIGNDTLIGDNGNDFLSGESGNDLLNGGAGKDTLDGGAGSDTLIGDSGNDSLNGDMGNDSLDGGDGNDTLIGGKGADTLTGGNGRNVFVYASGDGKDIITDYKVGYDKIKITSGSITSSSLSGSDVILKIGSGSITLKGMKDQKITVIDSNGKSTSQVYGNSSTTQKNITSSTTLTLSNSDSATIKATTNYKTIDASSRTKAINITGNSLANTINGGSSADTLSGGSGNDLINGNSGRDILNGDNGNDTLIGGKGNDTLTGGNGKDVFVYTSGDGNDVITDYSSSDKISISGSYSTLTSGDDFIIKVGSGRITLKNAATETINITTSNNYEERWFMDNEDSMQNDELESILDDQNNLISEDFNLNDQLKTSQEKIISLNYSSSKKNNLQ